jgi:Na+/proline symporter
VHPVAVLALRPVVDADFFERGARHLGEAERLYAEETAGRHLTDVINIALPDITTLVARNMGGSALSQALSIASLINGPVLGVFLVGTFLRRVSQPPALIGMVASICAMLYVFFATKIAWTWYVLLGSLITFIVAWLASFAFTPAPASMRDELAPAGTTED